MGLGIKNPFRTGAGQVKRDAAQATAAQEGRAANLSTLAGNWFEDPGRAQQRDSFMGALRTQLGDTTNRGFADTARNTKFRTARQGLTGGRVDVDRQQRNLQELFRRRIGDEAQVQDAGAGLRADDLRTRQSLLDSAFGASNVGQDAMRSFAGQQADNSRYLSTLLPGFVSGVGGDLAGAYSRRAEMEAFRRGMGGF